MTKWDCCKPYFIAPKGVPCTHIGKIRILANLCANAGVHNLLKTNQLR